MDPKIKALMAACLSIPFGLAFVGLLTKFELLPFIGTNGWNEMKLVVGLVFGITYLLAFEVFRRP